MLNMATVQEALKTWYKDGFNYQMDESTGPFYAMIDKNSEDVQGKDIKMALRYGKQGGIGNRTDDGDLPTPKSRSTKQAVWETKNIFAKIMLTDKTIKASKTSKGAFVQLLEQELEDALTDTKDDMNRQLFGDGNGTMATLEAGASATTHTVDSIQYLAEGQHVDIVDPADGSVIVEGRYIESIDDADNSVTFSGVAFAATAGHVIAIHGNWESELTGLGKVFTPGGTLYGIDRVSHKWLNPIVIDLNNVDLAETDIQAGIDRSSTRAGGKIDFLLTSHGVRRAYQDLQLTFKRAVNTMDLKGGFKAINYNGIALVADKYCPAGTMYMMETKDWALYQMEGWDWLSKDGQVLTKVDNKAAYWATLANYCDLGCSRVGAQVIMKNIPEM